MAGRQLIGGQRSEVPFSIIYFTRQLTTRMRRSPIGLGTADFKTTCHSLSARSSGSNAPHMGHSAAVGPIPKVAHVQVMPIDTMGG